jgi:prolipoprotein diacylglyceryltransferase
VALSQEVGATGVVVSLHFQASNESTAGGVGASAGLPLASGNGDYIPMLVHIPFPDAVVGEFVAAVVPPYHPSVLYEEVIAGTPLHSVLCVYTTTQELNLHCIIFLL